jgi:hypothetical protein
VAAYVEATNSFDLERLMATFAEDALVNDQLRDHRGKPAIREWVKREIIGVRLTMNVTKVINQNRASVRSAGHIGRNDRGDRHVDSQISYRLRRMISLDSMHQPRRALSAAQYTKSCNIKLAYVARLRDDTQPSFSMLREHENQAHIDDTIVR